MRTPLPRGRRAPALTTAILLALVASLPGNVPVVAGGPTCRVTNLTRGGTAGTLAKAVKVASAGDRLQVQGTCFGSTTIGRDLTIIGRKTAATGTPTLDGNRTGHVLRIGQTATVTIVGLTITHGKAYGAEWPDQSGGGIFSKGELTLRDVRVTGNRARASGGGLRLEGRTTLIRTTVSRNGVRDGDGCGIATGAALTIRDGAIRGNGPILEDGGCSGAGIYALYGSDVRLLGSTRIEMNDGGAREGAGIFVGDDGVVSLEDSSIVTANVTALSGGGIFVMCNGVLTSEGTEASHVFGNTPDDIAYAC